MSPLKKAVPHPSTGPDCDVCAALNRVQNATRAVHIELNALCCRLQRGYRSNETTRRILELLRPQLRIYAARIFKEKGNVDSFDEILANLQSETIMSLLRCSLDSEVYPLHYLFGQAIGCITWYVRHYSDPNYRQGTRLKELLGASKKKDETNEDDIGPSYGDHWSLEEWRASELGEDGMTECTRKAREIIATLPDFEHRWITERLPQTGYHRHFGRHGTYIEESLWGDLRDAVLEEGCRPQRYVIDTTPLPVEAKPPPHPMEIRVPGKPGRKKGPPKPPTPPKEPKEPKSKKVTRKRLTHDAIRAIRASSELQAVLMARYGISRQTVSDIQNRHTWVDVPDAPVPE